jgi:hypothetical protein
MSQHIPFLQIDSAHRISGTSSRFTIDVRPALPNSRSVSLEAVNLPLTHFNVQDSSSVQGTVGNNLMTFFDGTTNWNLVVPSGSYDSTTLISAINQKFVDLSFPATISISPTTFKMVVNSTIPISLTFGQTIINSIAFLLGFKSVDTAFATQHVADSAFNLSVPPCIFIKISEFPTFVRSTTPGVGSSLNFGRSVDGTFAVYTMTNSGGVSFYFPQTNWKSIVPGTISNLSTLNVSLWDPRTGGLLDIQGSEWTMLLKFEY